MLDLNRSLCPLHGLICMEALEPLGRKLNLAGEVNPLEIRGLDEKTNGELGVARDCIPHYCIVGLEKSSVSPCLS